MEPLDEAVGLGMVRGGHNDLNTPYFRELLEYG